MRNLTVSSADSISPVSTYSTMMGMTVTILQGLLEGLGWHDQRAEIQARDQKSQAISQDMCQAIARYLADPTEEAHVKLTDLLSSEIDSVTAKRDYLRQQQQDYQDQVDREKTTEQSSVNTSYSAGWGEWLMGGFKQQVSFRAAQQVRKYTSLIASREKQLRALRVNLKHLTGITSQEERLRQLQTSFTLLTGDSKETQKLLDKVNFELKSIKYPDTAEETIPSTRLYSHARRLLQEPMEEMEPMAEEFRVNTYTQGSQWNGNIHELKDGGFAIAWQSDGQDGSGEGVYAQQYTSKGMPLGSEFLVNNYTLGDQEHPVVTTLSRGDYIIAWMDMGNSMNMNNSMNNSMNGSMMDRQSSNMSGLYAQRYSSTGLRINDSFQINTPSLMPMSHEEDHFGMTVTPTDDLIVTWQNGDPILDVYVQRYSFDGMPLSTAFQPSNYTLGDKQHPNVGVFPNGDFAVTWSSYGQDGSGDGIYARLFSSTGLALGDEFQVNSYTMDNQNRPFIAVLTGGDFVISWQSSGQDGSGDGAYARRYASSGKPLGDEFQINTYSLGNQEHPIVAALTGGGFVFTWMNMGMRTEGSMNMSGSMNNSMMDPPSNSSDMSSAYVARVYSSSGMALGDEFQVNTRPLENQGLTSAEVSGLKDGRFVVTWTSYGQDGDKEGVYARIFSAPMEQKSSRRTLSPGKITAIAVGGGVGVTAALIGLGLCYKKRKAPTRTPVPKEIKETELLKTTGIFAETSPPPEQPLTAAEFSPKTSPVKPLVPAQEGEPVRVYNNNP
jgi:hypothetical protein